MVQGIAYIWDVRLFQRMYGSAKESILPGKNLVLHAGTDNNQKRNVIVRFAFLGAPGNRRK